MNEFLGDDHSVALQKSILARAGDIATNPLLANGGRILNILDPELYGWENIRIDAERDGFVGLTMVDRDPTLSKLAEVFGEGCTFPFWGAFTGTPKDVLPVCASIVSKIVLPDNWTVTGQTHPDDKSIHDAQVLNDQTGVAPTPAYFLQGDQIPSMLTCIHNDNGDLAACASGSMRYHPEGPLSGWFFAGAVSVSPDHRRMRLGTLVNALLLEQSHKAHAWTTVLEQAKEDNAPSIGMITRCGLRQESSKVTIVVNPSGRHVTR